MRKAVSLSTSTTSISIIAAVALWLLATWLEDEWSEPEQPSTEGQRAFVDKVTADTAIRSDGVLQNCRAAESDVLALVDASRSCVADSDCTIFDFGYPIQCLTSVAKSEITALRLEYRRYEQSCEYRVYYDCPSEPLTREPVCRNNQCTVDLQTLDILKDATLDHIGLEPGASPRSVSQ